MCLPEKPNAKTNSTFTPKAASSLPGVFGVLSLSCNDTVGCLGLQTCRDKPTMGPVHMQYVSRERVHTMQPKDKPYIYITPITQPPNVLPTQLSTHCNNYLFTLLFFLFSNIHRKLGSIVSPFRKKKDNFNEKIVGKKKHVYPVFP